MTDTCLDCQMYVSFQLGRQDDDMIYAPSRTLSIDETLRKLIDSEAAALCEWLRSPDVVARRIENWCQNHSHAFADLHERRMHDEALERKSWEFNEDSHEWDGAHASRLEHWSARYEGATCYVRADGAVHLEHAHGPRVAEGVKA